MTIEPFSLIASYSMFMARRCSAIGLSRYISEALANFSLISVSAVLRMMRACRSRCACASRDMASSRPCGICTSRISTDCTVTPHGLVLASRIFCNSRPSDSRSVTMSVSMCRPIDSRSPVCALSWIAETKSCTSRIDFSAFHTSQNTIASTNTGTASRVSVDSAFTSVTRMR